MIQVGIFAQPVYQRRRTYAADYWRCHVGRKGRNKGQVSDERGLPLLAGDRDAEQEGDEQACQRRFPRDRAYGGERSSRLPCRYDRFAETIDRSLKCRGHFGDGSRYIGCGIDGALCHAGLQLRRFDGHVSVLADAFSASPKIQNSMGPAPPVVRNKQRPQAGNASLINLFQRRAVT